MASTGQIVSLVVCVPGSPARAPCLSGQTTKSIQAFVLDAEPVEQKFSSVTAGQYFSFGLATVLACWLLGIAFGSILKLVKNA